MTNQKKKDIDKNSHFFNLREYNESKDTFTINVILKS